jgi:uncharacterized membrane protein YfcA
LFDLNVDFLLQVLGLLLAGIVKGVAGFGIGLVAVGLLAVFHPPQMVVPSLVVVYFLTDVALVFEHRNALSWKSFGSNAILSPWAMIMAIGGLPLGTFALREANPSSVTLVLGVLISAVSACYLGQERFFSRRRPGGGARTGRGATVWAAGVCLLSGFLEGFVGLGGPPLVIFMLIQRYSKFEFVFSFNLLFTVVTPLRFLLYVWAGLFDRAVLELTAVVTGCVLAGVFLGSFIRRNYVGEGAFRRVVIVILLLIGLNLIRKGI